MQQPRPALGRGVELEVQLGMRLRRSLPKRWRTKGIAWPSAQRLLAFLLRADD
jgi:hypothetical protein